MNSMFACSLRLRIIRADQNSDANDAPQWWLDHLISKLDQPAPDYIERFLDSLSQDVPSGEQRADYLGNLGILLARNGRFQQAEAALQESCQIRRESLGAIHASTQWMQCQLARLHDEMGRPEEAADLSSE